MRNLLFRQHLAHIRFAARVADHAGAAAEQHDRRVPRTLQVGSHHNRDKMADMQAVRRRVKANVKCRFPVVEKIPDLLLVRGLCNQAALFQFFVNTHVFFLHFCEGP